MVLEISLEQTNKIRASLGLRLIPDPSKPENVAQVNSNARDVQAKEIAVKAKLEKLQEQAKDRAVHEKATTGETLTSGKSESTSDWLKRIKSQAAARNAQSEEQAAVPVTTEPKTVQPVLQRVPTASTESRQAPEATELVLKPSESLDADDALVPVNHREQEQEQAIKEFKAGTKRVNENENEEDPLDRDDNLFAPTVVQSDYAEAKAVKFKKRKKLSKSNRHKTQDEVEDYTLVKPDQIVIDDDEELQRLLRENRIRAQQTRVDSVSETHNDQEDAPVENGIVISQTASFLASMRQRVAEARKGSTPEPVAVPVSEPEPVSEPVSESVPEPVLESAPEPAPEPVEAEAEAESDEESNDYVSGGLASTLKLLREKGVAQAPEIKQRGASDQDKRANRDWARRVAAERLDRLRNLEEEERSYANLPAKEREARQQLREKLTIKEEAQIAEAQFRNYKPVVDIVHKDAQGNVLSEKEAFKALSRQFHGNAEGKKRVEKRMERQSKETDLLKKSLFE